ncbi:MAG: hypothetical protein P4M00_24950 [Azospirillaceae bacterium]|nr:hypothetical protein [Azospirillaceae bacterium]
MTGMPLLDLAETNDATLRLRLPSSRPLARWYSDLVREIAARLSPAHAALLAVPVRTGAGWVWRAPGRSWRRFDELPPADRRALTQAIGVILSDIRRLGDSGLGPTVAEAGPTLCDVPDWNHVYVVDGRPVLVAWGHGGTDGTNTSSAELPARLDDGVPYRAPLPTPWPVYRGAFVAVLLLALVIGLLLPVLAARWLPTATACVAVPEQMTTLKAQNLAAEHGSELRKLLADLDDEIGRRRLQCPLRQASPAPTPAPVAAPAPAPAAPPHADQPHAALPQQQWNQHDLDMLDGCWTNTTNMRITFEQTHAVHDVKSWRICFDHSGHGHQTISLTNGETCEGSLTAEFNSDNELTLTDVSRCAGARLSVRKGRLICQRTDDSEATCDRVDLEGPARGMHQQGKFRR